MRRFATLFSCSFLFACTAAESVELGSIHVKSVLARASRETIVEVSADEHPDLAGTRLVIPAGALAADTKITVGIGLSQIVDAQASPAGPVVILGPPGTRFAVPVRLSIPGTIPADRRRLRIFVREADDTRRVLLPVDLEGQPGDGTVSFEVSHFTRFQCGQAESACAHVDCGGATCVEGECPANGQCQPDDCGPAPGTPSWTCEDGSPGGFTGRCLRDQNGGCGWEIVWCARACEPAECGPVPSNGPIVCANGLSLDPPRCVRGSDGVCAWEEQHCPVSCENTHCDPSQSCDANTGECVPGSIPCGDATCEPGTYCCNPSCGTCAPLGGACDARACVPCQTQNGATSCGPGQVCDPNGTGCRDPSGETCGNAVCPDGQSCCNASCGLCAPANLSCTQVACESCGNQTCLPGQTCDAQSQQCRAEECTADRCGPPPGLANWQCEDGTVGGPTGVCLADGQGGCAWEIRWCQEACAQGACGPLPDPNTTPCAQANADPAPTCSRNSDGSCSWRYDCETPCGMNLCPVGSYCCNESCGLCVSHGSGCTTQVCN